MQFIPTLALRPNLPLRTANDLDTFFAMIFLVHMTRSLLAIIALTNTLSTAKAFAADISVAPTGTDLKLIVFRGEIVQGDADRFRDIVRTVNIGAVLFESPGGNLLEGLQIGRAIREANFTTGVAPENACASACALAWLGGTTRYMAPTALVGFHSAYVEENGRVSQSGVGNALIGAYLNELGFGFEAVVFASTAAPNEMNWLNIAKAQQVGIEVVLLETDGSEARTEPGEQLRLPSGFRWIVLESSTSPSLLRTASLADQVVRTQNGYFASVIGPYERSVAENLLLTKAYIPSDAYLSSGNGFLFSLSR